MMWFKEHRAALQVENPESSPAELTKFGMNKYKQLYPVAEDKKQADTAGDDTPKQSVAAKRKLNDGQSGIAKLAKFNFSK